MIPCRSGQPCWHGVPIEEVALSGTDSQGRYDISEDLVQIKKPSEQISEAQLTYYIYPWGVKDSFITASR